MTTESIIREYRMGMISDHQAAKQIIELFYDVKTMSPVVLTSAVRGLVRKLGVQIMMAKVDDSALTNEVFFSWLYRRFGDRGLKSKS